MSGIYLKITRRGAGSRRGAGETRGLLADSRGAGCGCTVELAAPFSPLVCVLETFHN